jgi:hypothetical protein
MRVTIDAVMQKVPKGLYEKSGLRKWVARPQLQPAYVPSRQPAGPRVPRYSPSLRAQAVAYRAPERGTELGDLAGPMPQALHSRDVSTEGAPPFA